MHNSRKKDRDEFEEKTEICFRRLRLLAQRSEYFRSELTSLNHQTWFLPSDQAFASIGSGLNFLFDQSGADNINDVNDVIKIHFILSSAISFVFDSLSNLIFYLWLSFLMRWMQVNK